LFEAYTPGERDYSALVSKIKQSGADVLFLGGYHTEAGLIARQLNEQASHIQIIGGDSLMTDELWSIAGPSAEGLMMSFGPDPRNRPEARTAIEALRRKAFEPEGYTLYTYAAVQVIADGIKNGGKTDTLKVAAALRKEKADTVLGELGFDAKGDVTGPTYVMYKWHDGKYAQIGE
jgi:branched-chain amino acid transport system substrate-binding protein